MKDSWKNRIGREVFKLPGVRELWAARYAVEAPDTIPWAPLSKPLPECRMALVTTGGVHLQGDPPFEVDDPHGDPSFRRIPADAPADALTITHPYYDHTDAEQDRNLVLPMDILQELRASGEVGGATAEFFSFMGHIEGPHLKTLIQETALDAAREIRRQQADVALLVPA